MSTPAALADLIARANLHDDPLRFVLEFLDDSITRLETVSKRDPVSEDDMVRLMRAAAIGANAQAVDLIRAADRRARWRLATVWVATVVCAAAAGYLCR